MMPYHADSNYLTVQCTVECDSMCFKRVHTLNAHVKRGISNGMALSPCC